MVRRVGHRRHPHDQAVVDVVHPQEVHLVKQQVGQRRRIRLGPSPHRAEQRLPPAAVPGGHSDSENQLSSNNTVAASGDGDRLVKRRGLVRGHWLAGLCGHAL